MLALVRVPVLCPPAVAEPEILRQPGVAVPEAVVLGSARAVPEATNQAATNATMAATKSRAIRLLAPSEGPTNISLVCFNPHLLV